MQHELVENPLSWWLVLIITGLAFAGVAELGYRVGLKQPRESLEERKGHASVLLTALLALLGLLLAFSFSIVESRFSERKALVLEEANAIGTAYLRSEILPAPHNERVAELLRQYVELRLAPLTPAEIRRVIAQSEDLHTALWNQAVEVARANPESHVVALFLQSLNNVIDLNESRVNVGLHQRLPKAIFFVLYAVALLAMGMLGMHSGLTRWHSPISTAAIILAISVVIVLIVEFDRPGGRLVRVSQQAMQDVRKTINTRQRHISAFPLGPRTSCPQRAAGQMPQGFPSDAAPRRRSGTS